MFIFAHIGISLGAAVLLDRTLIKKHFRPLQKEEAEDLEQVSLEGEIPARGPFGVTVPWLVSLSHIIDIRLLFIGSLLPDIIDKPIGHLIFPEYFGTGRIFCHTLMFLIVICIGGLYLYRRRKKTWLLVLSFGTLTHVILDGMWLDPQTFFWPLYGLSFPRIDFGTWIDDMLYTLLNYPIVIIPELLGAIIILWFGLVLLYRKKICLFLRRGIV